MNIIPNGHIPRHLVMINITDDFFNILNVKEQLDKITMQPILLFDFGLRGLQAHVHRHIINQGGCYVSFSVSTPLYDKKAHYHKCAMGMKIAEAVPAEKHLLLFSYVKPDAFQNQIAHAACEHTCRVEIITNVPPNLLEGHAAQDSGIRVSPNSSISSASTRRRLAIQRDE